MAAQIVQTGATVRVIVNPRAIMSIEVVSGFLMVSYTDGTTENAGFIGGSGGVAATIFNTAGVSTLAAIEVNGFVDAANDIDARLTALGY